MITKSGVRIVLVLLAICWLAQTVQAQRVPPALPKKAPSVLVEDIRVLRDLLEKHHPSLYWYTSKDSMDYYFDAAIASMTDSLNEVAFKNKLSALLTHIRCGHTSVRFSKAYGKVAQQYRYPQFPLSIKAWDDSLVVLASAYRNDSIFKRGTIITAINGQSPRVILDSLYQFISTDGYADNHKSQVLSNSFPGWYKTIYGDADSVYRIRYIDTQGNEQEAERKAYRPVIDTSKQGRANTIRPSEVPKLSRREIRRLTKLNKRSMTIDTLRSTAYLRLTTFTGGDLKKFFRQSFRTLKKLGITNLVIDLRENGGGRVSNSIKLAQYLIDQSFRIGDTVAAKTRRLPAARYMRNKYFYWTGMNFLGKKLEDGRIHNRRYETHSYRADKRRHYQGQVYLLQGGYTFSAATMLIAQLKGQDNVTVLGEETGGGSYGNSAMFIPTLVLPHSKLEVSLPLFRLVMPPYRGNNTKGEKGRGIFPDVEVKPSSYAIQQGFDIKIRAVQQLIEQRKAKLTSQ
jgi:hypothetical protein